ncbi:MAG: acetyl-CoA carboxylase biotin carboxylase subunit [Megasphaera sp.]|uniref:acetyl-CoA carboxylase biotin carboxylase subunit n=1 Tax=Megasphaera sueciensis TaxID=349094 RepID=UPI003D042AB9|nr:acetyl-CoA carboxylase biotin carboxylase subunit [Megasphaera sp.]MCI1822862.1 acetyl-CoA carboxylase biotin carboxylase subunit [Megasphaera sp.]
MKIKKVLIANRGEIAVRIIKACHELDIKAVAVYSTADKAAMHVLQADEAYCIGPAPAAKSYLNVTALLTVAKAVHADAIHPGYGFLAENADFADACTSAGFIFIGPDGNAIRCMGDKSQARMTMLHADVPVVPGTADLIHYIEEGELVASQIGYPVLIKATAGGGGKGMRVVENERDLKKALHEATQEATRNFGNGGVYLEKYLTHAHHVEIQIMADSFGNVVALGERDCSTQRRHQKVIEEAPSPIMDAVMRRKMSAAAVAAAKAVRYCGAGTVEFIVDENRNFYFMEMNTRIQVEHGVSEMVTNTDLVQTQIRVAAGEPLPWRQEDIHIDGWSVECRINAEDPSNKFMPSPGKITTYAPPQGEGIRIDSCVLAGSEISPFYDSMVAKVLVKAPTRALAIQKMIHVLDNFHIEGIKTTIHLQRNILAGKVFQEGKMDTNYLEEHLDEYLS